MILGSHGCMGANEEEQTTGRGHAARRNGENKIHSVDEKKNDRWASITLRERIKTKRKQQIMPKIEATAVEKAGGRGSEKIRGLKLV